MILTSEQIEAEAEALFRAERSGEQTGLVSQRYPAAGLDDAYAIQAALVRRKLTAGRAVRGWKIGLTSRAMQMALNIDTPDSGVLFDDMFFADGATVPAGRFIQPRIEAEIAFVMKDDLPDGDLTEADVLAATAHVVPALEILDTRILRQDPATGRMRNVVDTIADNAANAGVVVGGLTMPAASVDLRWIGAVVSRDGQVEETGLAASVLNNPVTAVVWLARRLAANRDMIRRGDTVLSGSFIRPVECPPGTEIRADYGPLGAVSIRFA